MKYTIDIIETFQVENYYNIVSNINIGNTELLHCSTLDLAQRVVFGSLKSLPVLTQ